MQRCSQTQNVCSNSSHLIEPSRFTPHPPWRDEGVRKDAIPCSSGLPSSFMPRRLPPHREDSTVLKMLMLESGGATAWASSQPLLSLPVGFRLSTSTSNADKLLPPPPSFPTPPVGSPHTCFPEPENLTLTHNPGQEKNTGFLLSWMSGGGAGASLPISPSPYLLCGFHPVGVPHLPLFVHSAWLGAQSWSELGAS